jgi:MATE family multidrug resistance protein
MDFSHSTKIRSPEETKSSMIKNILMIGVPSTVTMLLELFVEVTNASFIGHLGDASMIAGVGLGNMYINIMCQSFYFGLNSALATLVSQSYGQGNLRMCGVYLNRARIVVISCFIPLIFVLLYAKDLFLLLNLDHDAAVYS